MDVGDGGAGTIFFSFDAGRLAASAPSGEVRDGVHWFGADLAPMGSIRRLGYSAVMRVGNVDIRPLGGGLGCLVMIVASIVLSVLCTLGANMFVR
jgi:hypothetical protein